MKTNEEKLETVLGILEDVLSEESLKDYRMELVPVSESRSLPCLDLYREDGGAHLQYFLSPVIKVVELYNLNYFVDEEKIHIF